jgi:hypothetical protein
MSDMSAGTTTGNTTGTTTGETAAPTRPTDDDAGRSSNEQSAVSSFARVAQRIPTGSTTRSEPGAPWWRYSRTPAPGRLTARERADRDARESADASPSATDEAAAPVDDRTGAAVSSDLHAPTTHRSGLVPGALAVLVLAAAVAIAKLTDEQRAGRFLLPLAAILIAAAFVPMLTRRHPDEPWLGKFVMWGMAFKIAAVLIRYYTFEGKGDAGTYHDYGVQYVRGVAAHLTELRETAFVMWVTAHTYDLVGADMITGFLAFGLFAFVGSYLWYRATATAVPFVNRRMYCAFVFFLPSIAFWPAALGKDALMQVGIGAAALGTAYMLRRELLRGLLIAAPGAYLMWAIRAHVFAIVAVSATLAYVLARREPAPGEVGPPSISVARALVAVMLAVASVFAVSSALDFLGMKSLSFDSIETELNETATQTAQGGSELQGQTSLTPLSLPIGAMTVLLRPFVWEVEIPSQFIASAEALAITIFAIKRWGSLTFAAARARTTPFLLYCWALVGLYAIAFASFSNMGLLVRQRSLVLPAFLALLCVEPALARRDQPDESAAVAAAR